jgi:hypothetical protein
MSAALLFTACGGDQSGSETESADSKAKLAFSDSLVIELAGADSVTVLDLVRGACEVDYRTTAAGAFVFAIDSIENGSDCFWIYTVNDNPVSLPSDEYFTSDGDRVKWHFRRFGD